MGTTGKMKEMSVKQLRKHLSEARYKQLQFSDKYKAARNIIDKRNKQIAALKNRMYDVRLIFSLLLQFREFDNNWFGKKQSAEGKIFVEEFFILLYALDKDQFMLHDAQTVIDNLPADLKRREDVKASACLYRLVNLKYLKTYSLNKLRYWFILPDGKWFLMQRTKDIRSIITSCLKSSYKVQRKIFGGRKI